MIPIPTYINDIFAMLCFIQTKVKGAAVTFKTTHPVSLCFHWHLRLVCIRCWFVQCTHANRHHFVAPDWLGRLFPSPMAPPSGPSSLQHVVGEQRRGSSSLHCSPARGREITSSSATSDGWRDTKLDSRSDLRWGTLTKAHNNAAAGLFSAFLLSLNCLAADHH